MNTSFYTGLAGMKAHQNGIDMLSDNISNVSTPGYRATTAEFSTIYSNELNSMDILTDPTSNSIGYGSVFKGGSINFRNGTLVSSDNKYDLAIEGSGFFGVQNTKGETFFTRAGNFNRDANGMLTNSEGEYVLGISANNTNNDIVIKDPNLNIKVENAEKQSPIHIPDTLTIPANPSTFVNFSGPLDPTIKEEITTDGKKVQIPNVEVYRSEVQDGDGNTNKLEITFIKKVPQQDISTTWNAKAILRDENGNSISESEGVLEFNGHGALTSNTLTAINNNGTPLKIDLGSPYQKGVANSGYEGLVSLPNTGDRKVTKDGNREGVLSDYYIDSEGIFMASFSNGKTIPISKVATYHFQNEGGLEKVGNSKFQESSNSGKAVFFTDEKGNFVDSSSIKSSKIELSNVDLTTALTDLIAMQKAYDASSKSITTSDQMIQNAINMKK
jgi:flagellar hook protein FlgE